MKGKLITIEGCEGVGKSTQIRLLREKFQKEGIPYIYTREPGGTEIAEQIRSVILKVYSQPMSDMCEILLYAAARAEHMEKVIMPALSQGKLVLCDRFIDSSFAYQAFARGAGLDVVETINRYATFGIMPDITVFLDYPPELAFSRKGGACAEDRLECETLEFHKKVYDGYVRLSELYKQRFIRVDASGAKLETADKLWAALKRKLKEIEVDCV